MKLHEIIALCEVGEQSISTEILFKYKKSLYTYYKRYYNCEPLLMVTDVFNACQYALIVPANEFQDAIDVYLSNDKEMSEEDRANQTELIAYQSILLKDF
jgi:hypothetical protein